MTPDEIRFITLLKLRLEKTKNLLNFKSNFYNSDALNIETPIYLNSLRNAPTLRSVPLLLTHKKSIIDKKNPEKKSFNNDLIDIKNSTLFNSFQLSMPKNSSDSIKKYALEKDSTQINYSNLFNNYLNVNKKIIEKKPKLFKPINKNNAATISPNVQILKVSSNNKKNLNKKITKTIEDSSQHIARDAIKKWHPNEIISKKIWTKNSNKSNQLQYNVYNHIATPTNNLFSNDESSLFKKYNILSTQNELPIKNELQIRKIENDLNKLQRAPERIITKKFYPQQKLFLQNGYEFNNEINNSNFGVIPVIKNDLILKSKIIGRPTHTFVQHQEKFLNNKKIKLKQSELMHNFEIFQNSLHNQDSAAFNGLLNCCQQQAPGCKQLCSKNISKEEVN